MFLVYSLLWNHVESFIPHLLHLLRLMLAVQYSLIAHWCSFLLILLIERLTTSCSSEADCGVRPRLMLTLARTTMQTIVRTIVWTIDAHAHAPKLTLTLYISTQLVSVRTPFFREESRYRTQFETVRTRFTEWVFFQKEEIGVFSK